MGKSLVPAGGQNTIEPARLGAAIITGPHYWNFDEITMAMKAAGGLQVVDDPDGLARAVRRDLDQPAQAQARAKAAFEYVERESRVLDVFMDHISPFLDAPTAPEKPRARA